MHSRGSMCRFGLFTLAILSYQLDVSARANLSTEDTEAVGSALSDKLLS